jgi:hypothetical protein
VTLLTLSTQGSGAGGLSGGSRKEVSALSTLSRMEAGVDYASSATHGHGWAEFSHSAGCRRVTALVGSAGGSVGGRSLRAHDGRSGEPHRRSKAVVRGRGGK